MNARLRWFSGWWGHPAIHIKFDFLLLRIAWHWRCRASMHHLFSCEERELQHTARQPQLGDSPPYYPHHGLSTATPLSGMLQEKGSTHSGFQKRKVNLICSAVELTKRFRRRCQLHYRESGVPSLLQWGNCVQTWQDTVLSSAGAGEL